MSSRNMQKLPADQELGPYSPTAANQPFAPARSMPNSPQAADQEKGGAYVNVPDKDNAAADAPARRYGCWQRLFLRHHNEKFADRAEFTVRATIVLWLMAMPFILPEGHFEKVDWLRKQDYFSRNTVLMFLLAADETFSQALCNASGGILGALLAAGNAVLMGEIVPGGVTADTPWFILLAAVTHAVVFVWLVMWLNFGMTTRIFCLMNFSYHWMHFMNPEKDGPVVGHQGVPFEGEIVQAALACGMAVFCSLFPVPILALRRTRQNAREMTSAFTRAWLDFSAFFCGSQSAEYRQDRLVGDLQKARDALESMEGHLLNSWYEFGWFRSVRQIRESLSRLRRTQQECCDRLFCMWNTCLQESFGGLHDELMPRLWPNVHRVIFEASRLIAHTTEVACGGRVFDSEEPALRDAAERTRAAVAALTGKFRELKLSLGADGILEELLDEQNFLLHVCAFGRLAAELAEDFLAQKGSLRPLPPAESPPGIFDRSILADRSHLNFAVRGFLTIFLGFLVGIFGHSKTMLKYDAGTAACVALLLRKSVGSSHARNLQRLRGVVVGTTAGHVTYSMIGWCTWWGYAGMSVALVSWVGASMYQHHDSSRPGAGLALGHTAAGASAGLLAAYFGTSGMLEQCSEEVYTVLDVLGRSYYTIINSLMAVFLGFLVDSVFAPEPASALATKSLGESFRCLSGALTDVLDPRILEVKLHSQETLYRIRAAEALGHQAEREPRYWRLNWRAALYNDAVQSHLRLRMSLLGMECSVVEGGRFGAGKAEKVRRLTNLPSFNMLRKVASEKMDHIEGLIDSAVSQETGDVMRALGNPQLKRNFIAEYMQAMHAFILDANRLPEISTERLAGNTLETDVAAQACLILSCVASMVAEAQTLQSSVLQRAF